MNARIYVFLACLTACLSLDRICEAADECGGREVLEQAWQALGDKPSSVPTTFMLDRDGVESFLSEKLSLRHGTLGNVRNLIRMKAVLAVNGEKGCLWLLAETRRHGIRTRANILRASNGCASYAELIQFLVDNLTDPAPAFGPFGAARAPCPLYDWRMCDLAYNELQRRLANWAGPAIAAQSAPADKPTTEPAAFAGVPLKAAMDYPERDLQIRNLYEWVQTNDARKILSSCPSALAALAGTQAPPGYVPLVQLILSRCRPRVLQLPDVPTWASLVDVLGNEYPPLTASEKAARNRLLGGMYSAKDVAVRLPADEPRGQGLIQWVLLKRPDRLQIARALSNLWNARRKRPCVSMSVSVVVTELAAELLRTWKESDAPASAVLLALLEDMSKDSCSWALRARARQALDQKPDGGK